MARQPQKRPLEDDDPSSAPDHPRQPKRVKTGHRLASNPPSPPPTQPEDSHLASGYETTLPPASPDGVAPLTRQNLAKLNNMSDRTVGPYSSTFEQILEDEGIHMDGDPSMLADLAQLLEERDVRPSLAPSECSDGAIEYIFEANANALSELDIERDVIPAIVGRHRLPRTGNVSWANMSSITRGLTVAPQPDLYFGTRVRDIPKPIRDEIGPLITPYNVPNAPALPHFVLETKGPAGSHQVVKRQAAHSGAGAARAALALENFRVMEDPVYHDHALAYAWTYTSSSGDLTHYAIRVGRPDGPRSSQPGYYLTRIKTHHITESVEQFRKGVSAFRHCRDESHAKSQARLAKACERLQRSLDSQPTSHPDTTTTITTTTTTTTKTIASFVGQEEVRVTVPAPLPTAQQAEDVDNDAGLASGYHNATPPPSLPEVDREMTTQEYYALLDQQLQRDCEASWFPQVPASAWAVSPQHEQHAHGAGSQDEQ
ncbi:hypothetical protein QBC45DRAFT_458854 [Copromyces sp. CBS 386.78]|nr:hypothetical protein QBC45DRAFT_458854 [Copromyces sp. CBS 386.78]